MVYCCRKSIKGGFCILTGSVELDQADILGEEEITALYRRGPRSKEAFEVIVKKYMKQAYFIALGLVGNHEDALDLSQEAFFRAYCNLDHLKKGNKFFPWFYQILRNLCFSHLRKRNKSQSSLNSLNHEHDETPLGHQFDPEMVAERNELKERLWKAIGQLDYKHREVIVLRHFQNLSYEQIAQVLFCSKGTVMSRLYYARKNLKKMLNSEKGGQ